MLSRGQEAVHTISSVPTRYASRNHDFHDKDYIRKCDGHHRLDRLAGGQDSRSDRLWSSERQSHKARTPGQFYLAKVVIDVQNNLERIS